MNNFFEQKLNVKNIPLSRKQYCIKFLKNKKVLHIGCTDYPIMNINNNLQIMLYKNNIAL